VQWAILLDNRRELMVHECILPPPAHITYGAAALPARFTTGIRPALSVELLQVLVRKRAHIQGRFRFGLNYVAAEAGFEDRRHDRGAQDCVVTRLMLREIFLDGWGGGWSLIWLQRWASCGVLIVARRSK
jgi:hypothetical protein